MNPVDNLLKLNLKDSIWIRQTLMVYHTIYCTCWLIYFFPKVQSLLISFFNVKELCKSSNADKVVKNDDRLWCHCVSFQLSRRYLWGEYPQETLHILSIDLTPLSPGILTVGAIMTVLIMCNTNTPNQETTSCCKIWYLLHIRGHTIAHQVYLVCSSKSMNVNVLHSF